MMQNITELVEALRRYKKSDIVDVGSNLLWDVFRNKENYPIERAQMINAYAPKLLMLGLATANNCRNNKLSEVAFYNFCGDFLGIKDPISYKEFMNNECDQIIENLKNQTAKKIPEEYLKTDIVRDICSVLFITRTVRQQHEVFLAGTNQFYMTYDILIRLNSCTDGIINKNFQTIFEVDLLHFMRAMFGLFTLGNNKSGKILFKGLTCDEGVKRKWEIDIDSCKSVAERISYNESALREKWYNGEVLLQPVLYQKYYPTPLYKYPLIAMDNSNGIDYFIPSPGLYIRGTRDAIFSKALNDKSLFSKLGNVIEEHILFGLKEIFGEERVSKISTSGNSRSADFYIDLDECVLIVECKSSAGGFADLSIMSPAHIAKIWTNLYNACEQCAASVKNVNVGSTAKPIIAIVLVATHVTAEALPFQVFASRSNIFNDLGIEHIEFLSWDALQHGLSKSSIKKFTNKLIERMKKKDTTIQEVMSFDLERDAPAHNYGHLKEREYEIFGKNFS